MGAGSSKKVHPEAAVHAASKTYRLSAQTCDETAQDLRRRFKAAAAEEAGLELQAPMLVVPYAKFVTLGKIVRNTDAAWRKQAMADGLLVEFDPSTMIAGFMGGQWWVMKHPQFSPDYEEGDGHGKKTNLRWRTICRGVGDVITACDLDPRKVVLFVDNARGGGERDAESQELFGKMLRSLTAYQAMCSFIFVPLEEIGVKVRYPEQLPGVGTRGYVLLDIFVYAMFAKAANEEVRYFYGSERETTRIPSIRYMGGPARDLPSHGNFVAESGRDFVRGVEDKVARAVAPALLDAAFARPWAPVLELGATLLSDESLLPFVPKLRAFTRLQTLDLESNRLSDAALTAVAGVPLPQLEALGLAYNSFGDGGMAALCAAIGKRQYPRLRVLSAHNNAVGDQGLLSLAGVCDSLGALQELALQQNKVGDAGMAKLCAAWAGSQAFKPSRVFLSHNALTSASLIALGDLGDASWRRLKSLKLEGNAFSDDALRSFGGKIKQYVLDKSCFTDFDPEKQLGITFPPWPKKVEVSGEPTIRLLSTDALLGCEALSTLNSDDVVRLHWKAKGHVRELFPEEAFKVCSLSELRDGVQYSALTYMWKTPWSAVLAELRDAVASPWVWIDAFCLNQTDGPEIARTLNCIDEIYVTASEYHVVGLESVSRGWCMREMGINPPQRKMHVHSSVLGVKGSDMVWLQAAREDGISLTFDKCALSDPQDRELVQKGIIKRFSTLAAFDDYVKAVVVPQLPDDAQKLLWVQRPGAAGR